MNDMQTKKQIFQCLHKAIGLTPKVYSFYDVNEISKIDIYIGIDRPDFGITTYSTIGLSNYPIGLATNVGKQIRVEFISVCNSDEFNFPNILASCAFNIINDMYSCKPGMVYRNVISNYYDNIDMKHIYFTTPYMWKNLDKIEYDDKVILWLMAIPISENEFKYIKENGSDALEILFENNNINVFDIKRKSIV